MEKEAAIPFKTRRPTLPYLIKHHTKETVIYFIYNVCTSFTMIKSYFCIKHIFSKKRTRTTT